MLGGIHGTFMYPQVLKEAPWIDAIVRGEGEQVFLNLVRAVDDGSFARTAMSVRGIAFLPTPAARSSRRRPSRRSRTWTAWRPDWGILDWDKYIYVPLGVRVAIPNFARGCPFTCSFCSQWKFWRDYRVRDPKKVVDEIGDAGARARRRLLHPRRRGADHPPQEVHRLLRGTDRAQPAIPWGINTASPTSCATRRCCRCTARPG